MVLISVGAPARVIPRPTGEKKVKGSITTTADYQTVCEYTVTKNKTFHPAKLTVSCDEDVYVKIVWDGEDISVEYRVPASVPFTNWFPYGWNPCEGDGSKKIEVQARMVSNPGECRAEICGEEE